MAILIWLAVLLFLALLTFGVLIFPVWMIVHCANRSDRSGKYRAGWIVGMIFSFPFGAYLYGIWQTGQKKHKIFSGIFIIFWLISIIGAFSALNLAKKMMLESIPTIEATVQATTLEEAGKQNVLSAIHTLERELNSMSLLSTQARNDMELILMLRESLRDKQLDQTEAQEWLNLFNVRATLDTEVMEDRRRSKTQNV